MQTGTTVRLLIDAMQTCKCREIVKKMHKKALAAACTCCFGFLSLHKCCTQHWLVVQACSKSSPKCVVHHETAQQHTCILLFVDTLA